MSSGPSVWIPLVGSSFGEATLYPWPQPDDAPCAGHVVVWNNASVFRGLLIDSMAVPLQFTQIPDVDDALDVSQERSIVERDEVLQRVRRVAHLVR